MEVKPYAIVQVAVHFVNQEESPGLKKGGVLNIVHHTLDLVCPANSIPESIEIDLTGKEITETLLYPHPESLMRTFGVVSTSGKPEIDESEFVNSRGTTVKYRSCVLPLSGGEDGKVAFLLGGMKWKAF